MLFTKKDKRTETERKLDEVLEEMETMQENPNEVAEWLKKEIEAVINVLNGMDPNEDDYAKVSQNLKRLIEALAAIDTKNVNQHLMDKADSIKKIVEAKETVKKKKIDKDVLAKGAIWILGGIGIALFETRHVWTGKLHGHWAKWKSF